MTANLLGQFARVLDYLDLPARAPQSRLRRQNPEPIDQLIAYWPEVRAALTVALTASSRLERRSPPAEAFI